MIGMTTSGKQKHKTIAHAAHYTGTGSSTHIVIPNVKNMSGFYLYAATNATPYADMWDSTNGRLSVPGITGIISRFNYSESILDFTVTGCNNDWVVWYVYFSEN